jgi:hypothetical protein
VVLIHLIFFCGLGLGHEANGWSKSAIGHVRTGPYDTGDIVFFKNSSLDGSDCNMNHEQMRITNAGNVACTDSIIGPSEPSEPLAGSQFPRKLRTIQYYRVLNIINLKLYNVL